LEGSRDAATPGTDRLGDPTCSSTAWGSNGTALRPPGRPRDANLSHTFASNFKDLRSTGRSGRIFRSRGTCGIGFSFLSARCRHVDLLKESRPVCPMRPGASQGVENRGTRLPSRPVPPVPFPVLSNLILLGERAGGSNPGEYQGPSQLAPRAGRYDTGAAVRGRQVLGQAIRQSKSPAPGVSGVVPFADALGGPVLGFRIANYSRYFKVLKVLIYPHRAWEWASVIRNDRRQKCPQIAGETRFSVHLAFIQPVAAARVGAQMTYMRV